MKILQIPKLPDEILKAAKMDELIIFVGSGVSMRVGASNWDRFANEVFKQLVNKGVSNYSIVDQINHLSPRKRLSIAKIIAKKKKINIDYKKTVLPNDASDSNNTSDIYNYLIQIGCNFITTNYDDYLHQRPKKMIFDLEEVEEFESEITPKRKIIYHPNDIYEGILEENNSIIHLHGSFSDESLNPLVITTEDYLKVYSEAKVIEFLTSLFTPGRFTILFLGYGLEEMEILEHLLRKGKADRNPEENFKRYWLEGFYSHEIDILDILNDYYENNFGVKIIPYKKDKLDYAQLDKVIEEWAYQIKRNKLQSIDKIKAINKITGDE